MSNDLADLNSGGAILACEASPAQEAQHHALIALGRKLLEVGYRFTTVTPKTHHIVDRRRDESKSLRSIFGWNRPFDLNDIDPDLVETLKQAGALEQLDGHYCSTVRFATIDDLIFAHSPFPTLGKNAVFFGPDTYRFVRLLRSSLADLSGKEELQVVDVGCGSGAGGLYTAKLLGTGIELTLADISQTALEYSAVNAAINGTVADTVLSDVLDKIDGEVDVIIANPPYLLDEEQRLYRHGGGDYGLGVATRIVEEALVKLRPGGRLVLYTGTPIADGVDLFFQSVHPLLQLYGQHFVYEEIDPDVFGEELLRPAYVNAERIAVVGLTAIK
jgi:methylase of polypeptide subunit release factors